MDASGWSAFHGARKITLAESADLLAAEQWRDGDPAAPSLLFFDDSTGRVIDVDLRQPIADVFTALDRATSSPADETPAAAPRGPGRPKLGVVAREVTLLPRHWDWLARRPGGASVALRKLVDEARRAAERSDGVRQAQEAAYRFMQALAGDAPHYEEALRALWARDGARFDAATADWACDVRDHARRLASPALATEKTATA